MTLFNPYNNFSLELINKLLQYCNLDTKIDCTNAIVDAVYGVSILKYFLICLILNRLTLTDLHCEVENWVNTNFESNITPIDLA